MNNKHEALRHFQKAVSITHRIANQLIRVRRPNRSPLTRQALSEHKIDYVVAPYEADAQLAHLVKSGKVDAVISEDSDLLVFGCRTVRCWRTESGVAVESGLVACIARIRFSECFLSLI